VFVDDAAFAIADPKQRNSAMQLVSATAWCSQLYGGRSMLSFSGSPITTFHIGLLFSHLSMNSRFNKVLRILKSVSLGIFVQHLNKVASQSIDERLMQLLFESSD
jgi:hypothetical protein